MATRERKKETKDGNVMDAPLLVPSLVKEQLVSGQEWDHRGVKRVESAR